MEKRNKSLRNKIVIMIGVLFVFIAIGAIYIANKAYALPTSTGTTKFEAVGNYAFAMAGSNNAYRGTDQLTGHSFVQSFPDSSHVTYDWNNIKSKLESDGITNITNMSGSYLNADGNIKSAILSGIGSSNNSYIYEGRVLVIKPTGDYFIVNVSSSKGGFNIDITSELNNNMAGWYYVSLLDSALIPQLVWSITVIYENINIPTTYIKLLDIDTLISGADEISYVSTLFNTSFNNLNNFQIIGVINGAGSNGFPEGIRTNDRAYAILEDESEQQLYDKGDGHFQGRTNTDFANDIFGTQRSHDIQGGELDIFDEHLTKNYFSNKNIIGLRFIKDGTEFLTISSVGIAQEIEAPKITVTPTIERTEDKKITSTVILNNIKEYASCNTVLTIPIDEKLENITNIVMTPSNVATTEIKDGNLVVTFTGQFKGNENFSISYKANEKSTSTKNEIDIDPVVTYYPANENTCPNLIVNNKNLEMTATGHDDENIISKIISNYYIENTTTSINEPAIQYVNKGSNYTTSGLSQIVGEDGTIYTLVAQPTNKDGIATSEIVEVNYYYRTTESSVIVHHYIKDTTTKLVNDETKNGKEGQSYITSAIETLKEHYTVIEPANKTGVFTNQTQEVIYYYEPKTYNLVMHHYLQGSTIKLADDKTDIVSYGSNYVTTSDSELAKHYEVTTPNNSTGTVSGNTEVIYYYTPKKYALTVHYYVEGTTTKLADDIVKEAEYNTSYETEAKTFENYNYVSVEGTPNGKIIDNTVVTYYYKLKDAGKITETHKDCTSGTCEIIPEVPDKEVCSDKKTGETCNMACPVVEGYTLKTTETFDISVTDKAQTIECKYEKTSGKPITTTPVDEEGNEIPEITTDTFCNDKYVNDMCHVTCKEQEGYILKTVPPYEDKKITSEVQEKVCVYEKKKPGTVNVIYKDNEGNVISTEIITGYVDDKYTTSEKKFSGYELIEVPLNKNGIYTEKEITVIYVYKKVNNPFTGDSNIIPLIVVTLGSLSVIGSAIYFFQKRKVSK